jgi:hypothetical protein
MPAARADNRQDRQIRLNLASRGRRFGFPVFPSCSREAILEQALDAFRRRQFYFPAFPREVFVMARSVTFRLGAAATFLVALASGVFAQSTTSALAQGTASRNVLDAEAEGLVDVRFIANDARSAQVLVTNRGDQPLTLQLPPAFAGVPVLAQMGGQQGAGFGAGGIGGQPQNVGGGGAQNAGMGIGGGAGGNPFCWVAREVYGVHDPRWLAFRSWMTWQAPAFLRDAYADHGEAFAAWLHERPVAKAAVRLAMNQVVANTSPAAHGGHLRVNPVIDSANEPFNVPAGKTVAVRAPTVCLDYGRREPTPRMPYRLVALETVSQDARLAVILEGLSYGYVSQKVAQAAAWHLSSGRTWEQLAAEVIQRAGGDPDVPFFSPAELAAAKNAIAVATKIVGDQRPPSAASSGSNASE